MTTATASPVLGTVTQLFIYPVKSMRGVEIAEAHAGLNGIYGDRRYAFVRGDLAGRDSFPWMTGRQQPRMVTYEPRFERPPTADEPYPPLFVRTPGGEELSVTDAGLQQRLEGEYRGALNFLCSGRGNYDSQHISLFSLSTLEALERESGVAIDRRQFRANIYMDLPEAQPFAEDAWLGRIVQIGSAVVGITKKDKRCMMINLDPGDGTQRPQVLRTVARYHEEQAGIYANVLVPGIIRPGDRIRTLAQVSLHGAED